MLYWEPINDELGNFQKIWV